MIREIYVPKARLGVIIGKNGETKKMIEELTSTKISINDMVVITGESINILSAEDIIKAIARGFSPENAIDLIEDDKVLQIIKISDKENELKRIRSRIIGRDGSVRKKLEEMTGSKISIYGKTVAIISNIRNADNIKLAIEKLIKGESHKRVYEFLKKRYVHEKKNSC